MEPARRTAACFACGRRIDLAATPPAAVAETDERAREALDALARGKPPRPARFPVAVEDPRLKDAVDRARRARGERNRLKALVDVLAAREEGFTLADLHAAARVLGLPPAAVDEYAARRSDLFQPRPGEYRAVR